VSLARHRNLRRLLQPRHVAVIGGREAETVAGECARIGYRGPVWPVNPHRESIGGHRCFRAVEDLPQAPDAAFVAVPREAAIDTVAQLSAIGAGGVVCHTAGFSETGAEGAGLEAALVAAAGDLALIGPNCYGVINYLDRAALWPFAHGGACPGYGAAIVTQSGMLSSDLTMSQRSVPFAFMASIGNQSVVTMADCIDAFGDFGGVRAIGLHIEEIPDVARFSAVVRKAVAAGVPVVALRTGVSEIGARLTASHTGALSGADDLYQALFDRLGVIRVSTPADLLETLKFLCVAGVPGGDRVAALTCSGGAAAMLADYAQGVGLRFPPPSRRTAARLAQCLPHTATVSNPLDYTTPIWGIPERVRPVFEAMLADPCDVALMVQDYPLEGLDESKGSYLSDARSFIAAARSAGVPAAVCSTLPENLDRTTREMLVAEGVAPMQGIREALDAIAGAVRHGRSRKRMRDEAHAAEAGSGGGAGWRDASAGSGSDAGRGNTVRVGDTVGTEVGTDAVPPIGAEGAFGAEAEAAEHVGANAGMVAGPRTGVRAKAVTGIRIGAETEVRVDEGAAMQGGADAEVEVGAVAHHAGIGPTVRNVDEHEAKRWLQGVGIPIPAGCVTNAHEAPEIAARLGFPVAVKFVSEHLLHKTEAGAVALGVSSPTEVEAAVARIGARARGSNAETAADRFLVERMIGPPLAELLVGVRTDPRFGLAMTLASGGVLTELVADAVTLLLPASWAELEEALARLRISRRLDGFRGAPPANRTVIVDALSRLASHLCREDNDVVEIEVNPLFVLPDRVCAVDALMRRPRPVRIPLEIGGG